MIRPLRSIHRLIFCICILVLPAVFIGGLVSRHSWPAAAVAAHQKTMQTKLLLPGKSRSSGEVGFEARLLTTPSDPNTRAIEIYSKTPATSPDVLVYWSSTRPGSNLPDSAQLLGPYQPNQQNRLPSESNDPGFVILYSLPQQRILASFSLGNQP